MPYIKNSAIKLYYEVIGEGEPIIFIHGNGNSVADWHDLGYVAALKDKYQLILFDCRGYGKSDKPHEITAYTPEKIVSDAIAVLDILNITKAYCFGYSMGGRIAFALMQYYPERFKGFVIGGENPYGSNDIRTALAEWVEKGMDYVVERIEQAYGPFPAAIRDRYLANDAKAMLAACLCPWPDMLGCLSQIDVPCLLYGGEYDASIEDIAQWAALIPNCEYHILKGKDHCQPVWDSKISVKLLDTFLSKLAK